MNTVKILGFELEERLAAALSYVLGIISGLFMIVFVQDNKNVRFHALQSILWFLVLLLVDLLLGWFTPFGRLISLVGFASMLFLAYNAYMGKKFKIPMLGDVAEKVVDK
ncbi:MAG: hypothetical protein FWG64_11500 [Firmicutes bacterium]|nr:hypothetical protein [Bacillota bacterium]